MMPYLIDGHNLIPKVRGLKLDTLDVETQLIELLQLFCRMERRKVEVYFDGAPAGSARERKYGMVTAHFIRKGIPADNAIIAHLRMLGKKARNWTVVTSDRQILAAAKSFRATTISSQKFSIQLVEAGESGYASEGGEVDGQMGDEDLKDWMSLFGIEDDQ
ncbi:MAG: NYN domain-containing protein [Anaerolineaceae bacterium]|nr:NYN domain-containing protein [Anaerolineaceae bacterium]